MEIIKYSSDTGNWDLGGHIVLKNDIPFIEVLKKAYDKKAILIVKTNYVDDNRPGAWYIKGYNSKYTYDEIKSKIEDNIKHNEFSKRICYLIKHD